MSAYDRLTELQRKFVEGYLAHGNAVKAYEDAGYKCRGATARVEASRTLTKPYIQDALAARRAQLARANDVTAEKVIEQWRRVAFFDPAQLAPLAGQTMPLTALAALPLEVRTALDVTIMAGEQGTMVTIRPKNSQTALDRLSTNLKLFGETDPLDALSTGMLGLVEALKARREHGALYR